MTDNLSPEARSALLSRIQGGFRRNKLERSVHNWLKGAHVRHRMNPDEIPGRPDAWIRLENGTGLGLFVDGDFWHACPRHFRAPKDPRPSWNHDLPAEERARARRRARLPYPWVRVWECEVKSGAYKARILSAVGRRTA
jgi:DNA mismatch endonuclease, patch repair protein